MQAADVVITMGCGDACPVYRGRRYLDWNLPDPAGLEGLSGEGTGAFFAGPDLGPMPIRPARTDENTSRPFLDWLR